MKATQFRGKTLGDRKYTGGTTGEALTGFGQEFVETGKLRGYGYVCGGKTGKFGKAVGGGAYELLRKSLRDGDLDGIVAAAKRLPTVSVRIDLNTSHPNNGGFQVSRKGCSLFHAQVYDNTAAA